MLLAQLLTTLQSIKDGRITQALSYGNVDDVLHALHMYLCLDARLRMWFVTKYWNMPWPARSSIEPNFCTSPPIPGASPHHDPNSFVICSRELARRATGFASISFASSCAACPRRYFPKMAAGLCSGVDDVPHSSSVFADASHTDLALQITSSFIKQCIVELDFELLQFRRCQQFYKGVCIVRGEHHRIKEFTHRPCTKLPSVRSMPKITAAAGRILLKQ